MKYLRLFYVFLRAGILGELAYRSHFFIRLFQSILDLATALAGLAVVFSYTETLGGWRPNEIIALLGIYLFAGGIINLIIQPGMQEFIEGVREGSLDFTLTKPEDAQLLVSIRRVDIWGAIDILLGTGVLIFALLRLGSQISLLQFFIFAVMLLSGMFIVYSFWLILATCAFWFVRVENILYIFQSMYEAGRWPVSLYPGWLRYSLTFIVPVAFATTVPAQAITGRLTWSIALTALAVAAGLVFLSRLFWKIGLRHYSGASA